MKHPYIPLYVGDWLKDPKLSLCSPATRGVWIDLICCLHELDQGGKITANAQQIARLCRSSDADIHAALKELQTTEAADVYERDGVYTVICRRMRKIAELSFKRQQAGSKAHSKKEANPDIDIEDGIESGLERVRTFCLTEGISQDDADWFYWKGKGNGWTNGGKPMLDWKATLRSWKRGGYLPSQRAAQQPGRNSQRPMSAFEIEKRIAAIGDEINQTWKRNGSKRLPGDGIDELKKRRDELHRQLVA